MEFNPKSLPGQKRFVAGGRMTKVRREVLRRMERIAQGLPATEAKQRKENLSLWTRITQDESGWKILKLDCQCGKQHVMKFMLKKCTRGGAKDRQGGGEKIAGVYIQLWARMVTPKTYKEKQWRTDPISNMKKADLLRLIEETGQL